MNTIKVGIIGCGNISAIYFNNCSQFKSLEVIACADLDVERAKDKAKTYHIPQALTVEALLAHPDIDLIINLTIPAAHAEVCIRALESGKHVYVEKPLAVSREEGLRILETAQAKGLRVGSAPDTFLGGGIQTALHLIEQGAIGRPIGASAFMIGRGHEHWHPDPAFYYQAGGGPMFDMGPYYLTALAVLLGPMKRVCGSARISYPQRTISSEPKRGTSISVDIPTHISGVIDFESGAIATLTTSFDAFGGTSLPHIEIYGSEGTLLVPDPNTFGGKVMLRKRDDETFNDIALTHGNTDNCRGIGVADMASAILIGGQHQANGQLAYHVLEAMHGFHDASASGHYYPLSSTFNPLPSLAKDYNPFIPS